MNKTVSWVIVGIVVVLGGWYWYASTHSSTGNDYGYNYGNQSSTTDTSGSQPAPASSKTNSTAGSKTTTSTSTKTSTSAGVKGSAGQTNTGQVVVPPVLKIATSPTLGKYLIAENGMTLYHYTKDGNNVSNCMSGCISSWPPYIVNTKEPLVVGSDIKGMLTTITRVDGSAQLTYNGMPLYFWAGDKKVGDTNGQSIGSVWFVVTP